MACGCESDDNKEGEGGGGAAGLDGIVTLPDGSTSDGGDGDGDGDSAVDEGDPDGSIVDGGDGDGDGSVSAPDGGDGDAGDSGLCESDTEICNEVDDDCDDRIDEDLDVGDACDGPDDDDCQQGRLACGDDGEVVCEEAPRDLSLEICDGIDNDCDDELDEGFDNLGDACDGSDDDLCADGEIECNSAGDDTRCSDDATELLDICNNLDDDCDPASADGSEDSRLGDACDGADTDLCTEGTYSCAGSIVCSDATGSTADVCNAVDDDCDPASANGSEDPLNATTCDGADLDACPEGTYSCVGTAMVCSDATGSAVETCNGANDDCDAATDEGFLRDTNPVCASDSVDLGTIGGNVRADVVGEQQYEERWFEVYVEDDSINTLYLSATVELTSPESTDYDLFVYCDTCGGTLAGSSTETDPLDTVLVRKENTVGVNDGFTLLIEVRHWSSSVCAEWELEVIGNELVNDVTCL